LKKPRKLSIRLKYRGRDVTPRLYARLRGYLRENWGAPFVVGFMVLLLTAAGYLAIGLEKTANLLAKYESFAGSHHLNYQLTSKLLSESKNYELVAVEALQSREFARAFA